MQLLELCKEILKKKGFYKQAFVYETAEEASKIKTAISKDFQVSADTYGGYIPIDGNVHIENSISLPQAMVLIPIFNILALSGDWDKNFKEVILFRKNDSIESEYLNMAIIVNENENTVSKSFVVSDKELKYAAVKFKCNYNAEIKKLHLFKDIYFGG